METLEFEIVALNGLFLAVQKLSALSTTLAQVVSSTEDEEAELDKFPVEEVKKHSSHND